MRNIQVYKLILLVLSLLIFVLTSTSATIKVIKLPDSCIAPDAVMDVNGVLHVVYGYGKDACYVRSNDNGTTFTQPVKLNGTEGVTTIMGERGPKIALGKDSSIHIVWADRWSPGVHVLARYTRSLDGGKTFDPPKAVSDVWGFDGLTMTADAVGHVLVFWHKNDERQPVEKQATWLNMVKSSDNGVTFDKSEPLKITGQNGLACSMCMMRARIATDGRVYLAFRSATDNIRDFYVLASKPTENNFTAVRVNTDNWKLNECPMCGPELTLAHDGRAICAFMSEYKVYWSVADAMLTSFTQHVATTDNEKNEIYPVAISNKNGDVLFVWQVGPMSTTGTAVVKWATYTVDGKATGDKGIAGTTSSGTKATAFVGTDDNFYILTTAK